MKTKFNICLAELPNYNHTDAFLEIVDLLQFALRDLGHEVKVSKNGIDSKSRNILIGIHLMNPAVAKQIPADTIILNTEQLGSAFGNWNQKIVNWFSHDFTLWDYSDKNVEYLKQFGVKTVKKLQLGFQKELCRIKPKSDKDVDVLFYGSVNEQRKKILDDLRSHGLHVKTLFGVYGAERDEWISRSKLVLNHHFHKAQIFEIVRVFYLMTNGIPTLVEVNPDSQMDQAYQDGLLCSPYEKLVDAAISVLGDETELDQLGARAKETIQRLPQKDLLQEIL